LEVRPLPSHEKKDKVKQIRKWFDKSDSLLVIHYKGLKVSEANELRTRVGEMGSELRVLKNTLTRIALAETPREGLSQLMEGPVAVVFVKEDPAPVARAVREFARGRKDFYLLGGMLEGRVMSGSEVEAFALLPPREVLLAQVAGALQAPLSSFASLTVAPLRKALGLFQALADKMAAEGGAPGAQEPEPVTGDSAGDVEPEVVVEAGVSREAGTEGAEVQAEDMGEAAEEPPAGEPAVEEEAAATEDKEE
jgi:large subunit ribosomal protein L10